MTDIAIRKAKEIDADLKIRGLGLVPSPIREPNPTVAKSFVFRQDPRPGAKINKGGQVTLYVSSGKPQVTVPDVRGISSTDAVSQLSNIHLKAKIVQVNSDKPTGQVIDQTPQGGASIDQGSTVTLKVSKGPQPIAVPSVPNTSMKPAVVTPPTSSARLTASALRSMPPSAPTRRAR